MQSLRWYLNRAKAMSAPELAMRSWRQLRASAERLGVAGAPAVELQWPPRGGIDAFPAPARVSPERHVEAAEALHRGEFGFFGRRFALGLPPAWNTDPLTGTRAPLAFGKTLDYRDSRVVGDAKHLWELNRHLELVTLAQAFRASGDPAHLDTLSVLVASWIDQCPYLKGPNWCSSLELGVRLINWHLAYGIAGGAASPLFAGREGQAFRDRWLRSIYLHAHFIRHHLSTFPSSANNHLIGELSGLFVACCTWPCWPAAARWREVARTGLHREIERQVHADGVDKEQSTSYQQFVACLFLVAGIAGLRAGVPFEPGYWQKVERMLEFVAAMMDAGANVPAIGDGDDGLAFALEPRAELDPFRAVLAVGAVLFDRPEWRTLARGAEETADWLCAGLGPLDARAAGSRATRASGEQPTLDFPQGGYYVLGKALGARDEVRAVVDAGPLGFLSIAGHGHADCLALLLAVAGRPQLIDPGTYVYHADRRWRDYFRGTAAHNTVRVDGLDQSEIGGPFLWLFKAEAAVERLERTVGHDLVTASHDGYLRLPDPVRHERTIRFDKASDTFEITDRLLCRGRHRVERFWHFAATCRVELRGARAESDDGVVRLVLEADERDATATLLRGSVEPIGGWTSPRFGCKVPAATVVFANEIDGDATLRTRISVRIARAGEADLQAPQNIQKVCKLQGSESTSAEPRAAPAAAGVRSGGE